MATIEFTTNAVAPEVTSAQEKDLTLPESVADKIKKKKKTKVSKRFFFFVFNNLG